MGDMDMLDFIRQNIFCGVMVLTGLFFVVCNFIVMFSRRYRKSHTSGIPFLGGLLIAIGFLTTPKPFKWLALLGILDPSICGLFVSFYYGKNENAILEKRYAPFLSEKNYDPVREDDDLKIVSRIIYKDREEFPHEQEFPYITKKAFRLGYPWALIMVTEKDGKRFLILDTGTEESLKKFDPEKVRILPFDDEEIVLHDIADYLEGEVVIRLVKKTHREKRLEEEENAAVEAELRQFSDK